MDDTDEDPDYTSARSAGRGARLAQHLETEKRRGRSPSIVSSISSLSSIEDTPAALTTAFDEELVLSSEESDEETVSIIGEWHTFGKFFKSQLKDYRFRRATSDAHRQVFLQSRGRLGTCYIPVLVISQLLIVICCF